MNRGPGRWRDWALAALLALALAVQAAPADAQDATRGRALYQGICSLCHSDPPGSGAVNPLVRSPDAIRAAINRVSPMRFLADQLSPADLVDIAAYFVTVLGPAIDAPDFDVSGQWASPTQPWWGLFVTQYAGRTLLTGGWLTFDAQGNPMWLYFFEAGGWTGPGIYVATLFRNSGPAFATPPESGGELPKAAPIGTIAFVFSDRNSADVTFELDGIRIAHRIARVVYPK